MIIMHSTAWISKAIKTAPAFYLYSLIYQTSTLNENDFLWVNVLSGGKGANHFLRIVPLWLNKASQ